MSGMIRRLRWKIVGISMLFVTLVLAAVFTGVMLTARSSLEQSSTRQLEKALRGEGYDGQNGQPCFVTEVYSSGTVRVMGSSYYQISEEDLLALVQECLSQQEESGLLTDYHLRYLRYDGALSTRIAFTDSTLEQSALRAMAGDLLLIALAALVVLLGCSYLLSGVAGPPGGRGGRREPRPVLRCCRTRTGPVSGRGKGRGTAFSWGDLQREKIQVKDRRFLGRCQEKDICRLYPRCRLC